MILRLLTKLFNFRKDTYPVYAKISKKTKSKVKVVAPGKPDTGNTGKEWQEFNNE